MNAVRTLIATARAVGQQMERILGSGFRRFSTIAMSLRA
jgi:hypothetical protein